MNLRSCGPSGRIWEWGSISAEVARLQAAGVCGVRVNVSPVKMPEQGFAARLRPRIERLAARCPEFGWQVDFLMDMPAWIRSFDKVKAQAPLELILPGHDVLMRQNYPKVVEDVTRLV